ncbi:MAG: hypothetical protein AAFP69_21940, partial [Planctomycetota bacterium]
PIGDDPSRSRYPRIGNPSKANAIGFPLPIGLDAFNGHNDDQGHYHYHASRSFPYINGGLRGVVEMNSDQIQQPRDSPIRPGQQPLRGATITGFERNGDQFQLTYSVSGRDNRIQYQLMADESVQFSFVDASGSTSTATYQRGRAPGRAGGGVGFMVLAPIAFLFLLAIVAFLFRRKRPGLS